MNSSTAYIHFKETHNFQPTLSATLKAGGRPEQHEGPQYYKVALLIG